MLAPYGFHISTLPTAQLVALSDRFIAFASSTIRWAVCCGVPVINYDVFSYDFQEYKNTIGIFDVKTNRQLSLLASKLSFGSAFYQETKTRIDSDTRTTDMFDGHSVDRIDAVLQSLVVKTKSDIS